MCITYILNIILGGEMEEQEDYNAQNSSFHVSFPKHEHC